MLIENDPGFWKWIAGGIASLAASAWGFLRWHHGQMGNKAGKDEMARCLDHIEKLHENAAADRKLTRDLHDKAMEAVRDGQRQIIELLTRR